MLGLTCLFCFPESLFLRLLVSCGMTFILLLLGLCLWCVKKQGQMIRGKLKSANQLRSILVAPVVLFYRGNASKIDTYE